MQVVYCSYQKFKLWDCSIYFSLDTLGGPTILLSCYYEQGYSWVCLPSTLTQSVKQHKGCSQTFFWEWYVIWWELMWCTCSSNHHIIEIIFTDYLTNWPKWGVFDRQTPLTISNVVCVGDSLSTWCSMPIITVKLWACISFIPDNWNLWAA